MTLSADQTASAPAPSAGKEKSRPSPRALLPLVPYLLRYKGRIAGALLGVILASAATLAVPLAIRRMIDYGFSAESAGLIDTYFLGLIGVAAVLGLASGLRFYYVTTLGERIAADLRADVFKHLCRLDAAFFDKARTGELLSRLTADTTQMKSTFGVTSAVALRNFFLFIGSVGLMVVTSPKLSAFVLVAIPIIVLPLVTFGRSVRKRSRAAQDTLAEASAFAAENLGAVRVMQAFGAQAETGRRFKSAVDEAYMAASNATAARARLTIVAIFLVFASVVCVLWFGAQDVLADRMTGGLLSQFVLYAILAAGALGELSQVWGEIAAASGAAGRIAEILQVRPTIVAPANPVALPVPARGDIAFETVDFFYASRPQDAALHGLSLKIAAGERVAIVGPSGAGKSTLFQLLMRFYDPVHGRILLDGVDIATVDPALLRQRIRSVPQDPVIFGTSILDNIRYGAPDASDEAVRHAARRAAAESFIEALPDGYETKIGERGITLSGGQRQRLAIARAIVTQAPVLLLDEATSALDSENEILVQTALRDVMSDRTTLVIAHRLSTVLEADRILVLDNGRLVEEGTHASLVAKNGLYARLAKLQFETGGSSRGAGEIAAAE
jgi:ATP-binding cassette subfamily B protein